jgi:myo-inositol-1-phosphate synthase
VNALGSDKVHIAPLGYLPHVESQKIAHIHIEAQGWGETAVSLDVRLQVHDPSGAAGVNIDLIRLAAIAFRSRCGGYNLDEPRIDRAVEKHPGRGPRARSKTGTGNRQIGQFQPML